MFLTLGLQLLIEIVDVVRAALLGPAVVVLQVVVAGWLHVVPVVARRRLLLQSAQDVFQLGSRHVLKK